MWGVGFAKVNGQLQTDKVGKARKAKKGGTRNGGRSSFLIGFEGGEKRTLDEEERAEGGQKGKGGGRGCGLSTYQKGIKRKKKPTSFGTQGRGKSKRENQGRGSSRRDREMGTRAENLYGLVGRR